MSFSDWAVLSEMYFLRELDVLEELVFVGFVLQKNAHARLEMVLLVQKLLQSVVHRGENTFARWRVTLLAFAAVSLLKASIWSVRFWSALLSLVTVDFTLRTYES